MALSRFSTLYTAHGMLFLSFRASLSQFASSRPTYLFLGPVIHYSCRLGLMVLLPTLSILYCPCYWAFFLTNGPQHLAPWTYETFMRFICEWKGVSALLSSHLFSSSLFRGSFLSCGLLLIYIYIYYIFLPAANRVASSNFPVWQLFSKQSRRFINFIPFWWLTRHIPSCHY